MKPTISKFTMVLAALVVLAAAKPALADSKTCSNATLNGNYAAVLTGFSGGFAFSALDLATADGNGNLTGTGTVNVNGTVSTGVPISATYTINSDCSGTVTFSSGTTQALIVKTDGSVVYIIRTGPPSTGTVVSGTATRLSNHD